MGGGWTAATTTYTYDAQNRVIQTVNPDGGTNITVYDLAGQQQATIDASGIMTSNTYDPDGHLICYRFNWRHKICRNGVIADWGGLPRWHQLLQPNCHAAIIALRWG
ncbi:MAG TPA: hypothetical protein VGY56_02015 [Verrucomicrobiae bacterium]|nr:hypothetical protein [Verrucomicrobiae bacterium]